MTPEELSALWNKEGSLTTEETLAVINAVAPTALAPQTFKVTTSSAGKGGFVYRINDKKVDKGSTALDAFFKNNGITPSSNKYKTGTYTQDITQAPWFKDIQDKTNKGETFLLFAQQVDKVPELAKSLQDSRIGGNSETATSFMTNSAILWNSVDELAKKGYNTFEDIVKEGKPISLNTTFEGKGSTTFKVNFDNGVPYIGTQSAENKNPLAKIAPIVGLGLSIFAPGAGTAIGTALGASGTAASVIGGGLISGALTAAGGGDFVKGALTGAIGAGAGSVLKDVGAGVSEAVGGGTIGDVASGAVTGAAKSALAGGDVLSGALTGGVSGGLSTISPEIKEAFGGGTTGDVASGLLTGAAGAAISGKDIGTGALTGALKGIATTTPTQALDYSYADDAAMLAEQGLSASQITDILGAADAPPDVANSIANYAVNAIDIGLQGEDVTNYINNEFTADAQFSAADAGQLFDQGLANKQVQDVLDATKQGDALTNLGMDAEFIATDAERLWNQTNNVGAVEQNLVYSGVDPIVAASLANEVAFGAPKEELTDLILSASDPNALTTDGTLFTENPEVDTSGSLKPIKTQAIPQQQQIPTVNAQASSALGNMDNSLFLLDRSRYADLGNPFLRTSASYKNIVGNIFGG